MNIMEDILKVRTCIEMLANDIKIYTVNQCMFHS